MYFTSLISKFFVPAGVLISTRLFLFLPISPLPIGDWKNINFFFKSNKVDYKLIELADNYENKKIPIMPLKANMLMEKYNIPEGKELGAKLKAIEEVWTNNNFKISDEEVQKIVSN